MNNGLIDLEESSTYCSTNSFGQIQFEINKTTTCKFETKDMDCSSLQTSLKNIVSFTPTYICNCGICDTPILVQVYDLLLAFNV
uniref:Phlebovirus glycoprotein G2 fusion domain-containing protein n=1 Tax=Heterorhabditis bacteriophora TaxID=37862 RepID=A0A1I7XSP5_HETBA